MNVSVKPLLVANSLIDEVTAAAGQKKSPDLLQLVEPHGSSAERKAAAMDVCSK